jgi:predicted enzyme related to lactoylglutathione lyase
MRKPAKEATVGNPVCHFEFLVSDTAKAREFYGRVFDWKFTQDDKMDYTMIDTGAEPGGGIMKKPDQAPYFCLNGYFLVDSIDETLKKATDAGAAPSVPKMEIPTVGWWAMFMDPDGIPVMLFEPLKR